LQELGNLSSSQNIIPTKIEFVDIAGLVKRASKEIGSSLEANLKIEINQKLKNLTENTDFSELCITSKAEVSYKEDAETTAITSKAKGTKCPVCWKINEGPCPRHG